MIKCFTFGICKCLSIRLFTSHRANYNFAQERTFTNFAIAFFFLMNNAEGFNKDVSNMNFRITKYRKALIPCISFKTVFLMWSSKRRPINTLSNLEMSALNLYPIIVCVYAVILSHDFVFHFILADLYSLCWFHLLCFYLIKPPVILYHDRTDFSLFHRNIIRNVCV